MPNLIDMKKRIIAVLMTDDNCCHTNCMTLLYIYPYKGFGNHPELVIKPEDADFVDIVHTASDNMSFLEPLGHADFYPNGGQNQVFEKYLTLLTLLTEN